MGGSGVKVGCGVKVGGGVYAGVGVTADVTPAVSGEASGLLDGAVDDKTGWLKTSTPANIDTTPLMDRDVRSMPLLDRLIIIARAAVAKW